MPVQVEDHYTRNALVAGAIGLVGGLGGGVATMAGPQAYPRADPWIWEMLLWCGIALFVGAAGYLLYEYVVRPRRSGKPKVDPLQTIALVAAIVLAVALFLQWWRGPPNDPRITTLQSQLGAAQNELAEERKTKGAAGVPQLPPSPRPKYVRDLRLGSQPTGREAIFLEGIPTETLDVRIRVFVDVEHRIIHTTGNWGKYPRLQVNELADGIVSGVYVNIPIAFRTADPKTQNVIWWGPPEKNYQAMHSGGLGIPAVTRGKSGIAPAGKASPVLLFFRRS